MAAAVTAGVQYLVALAAVAVLAAAAYVAIVVAENRAQRHARPSVAAAQPVAGSRDRRLAGKARRRARRGVRSPDNPNGRTTP